MSKDKGDERTADLDANDLGLVHQAVSVALDCLVILRRFDDRSDDRSYEQAKELTDVVLEKFEGGEYRDQLADMARLERRLAVMGDPGCEEGFPDWDEWFSFLCRD